MLDSNLDAETQTAWLDRQLANSDATWKFVVTHHGAYTSRPGRYYGGVSEVWAPVIERHGVDMVFQGHDHAYLRTHPMQGGEVAEDGEGTVYVISNAGSKHYEQDDHPYTAVGLTDTQFYQTIDVQLDDDRLVYRAYTLDGEMVDEVVLTKD